MTLYNERDRHNVDNSNPTLRVVGYGESCDEIAKFAQSDLQLEACRLKLFYISCSFTLNM
jgi:hypothetical protein